jgi:hypothetical protein
VRHSDIRLTERTLVVMRHETRASPSNEHRLVTNRGETTTTREDQRNSLTSLLLFDRDSVIAHRRTDHLLVRLPLPLVGCFVNTDPFTVRMFAPLLS